MRYLAKATGAYAQGPIQPVFSDALEDLYVLTVRVLVHVRSDPEARGVVLLQFRAPMHLRAKGEVEGESACDAVRPRVRGTVVGRHAVR